MDLVDRGVDPDVPVPHAAERLVEERRLFNVATTRATDYLLVTAVDSDAGDNVDVPSRFIDEFCAEFEITPAKLRLNSAPQADLGDDAETLVRVLAHDDLIAEFRRVLTDPDAGEAKRAQAARQLARLANAGVLGADPQQWWTTTQPSTDEPLGQHPALSPSRIESLLECPMRNVLERMAGLNESLPMVYGAMGHAYLEALGRGVNPDDAYNAVVAARKEATDVPAWKRERDIEEFEEMLNRTRTWLEASRGAFEQVAVETSVDVQVSDNVRIRGRVDRLERDSSGALYVVDLKTGKNAIAQKDADNNAQLLAYQLALSKGALAADGRVTTADGDSDLDVGGAMLVYPAKETSSISTREQAAKTPEELQEFAEAIDGLPDEMTGPTLLATTGPHCDRCSVRALCPVQPEGEMIHNA